MEYVAALHSYRIDPTYCPIKCQYSWANFDNVSKKYPKPLNFLELLAAVDRFCTKKYFTFSLRHTINLFEGVPNLAYRMLVKIACTLLLCINIFSKEPPHNQAWKIMLEGIQSLAFDLRI